MHTTALTVVALSVTAASANAKYTVHLDPAAHRSAGGGISATISEVGGTHDYEYLTIDFVFDQPLRVNLVDGATDVALYANFRIFTDGSTPPMSPVDAQNRWVAEGALGSPNMYDNDMMRGRFMGTSGRGLVWGGSFRADDSLIDGYTFDTLRLNVKLPSYGVDSFDYGMLTIGITGSPESGFITVPAPASMLCLAGLAAVRRRR